MLNVRYVLSTEPIAGSETVEVYRTPPTEATPFRYVYKRTTALPRAWIVGRTDTPPPGLTVLDALCNSNLREDCLVSDRPIAGTAKYQVLPLERQAPGSATLKVTSEAPGVAVLSESRYPDWRATDNGKPVEVRRVNHELPGIQIPSGDLVLRVHYYPWDFYVGTALSVITCVLISLAYAVSVLKKRAAPQV